jgi:hypothetical protein
MWTWNINIQEQRTHNLNSGLILMMVFIISRIEKIINWFNIQSLPLVRKLYARYDNDLAKGKYTVVIRNSNIIN